MRSHWRERVIHDPPVDMARCATKATVTAGGGQQRRRQRDRHGRSLPSLVLESGISRHCVGYADTCPEIEKDGVVRFGHATPGSHSIQTVAFVFDRRAPRTKPSKGIAIIGVSARFRFITPSKRRLV